MKNVLITGTSSGVGYACALLYARHGFKVYATMRDTSKGAALMKEAQQEHLALHLLQLDVTDTESIRAAVQTVVEQDGRIDVLVNNAGAGFGRTTEQATEEEIDWVTQVNYLGVVRCTKQVLPVMREARAGHIINVTSVGGLVGQPFNEFYCAAKFAVEGYTESLASYVSDAFGIVFTLVEPGGIATEFMKSAMAVTTTDDGQLASGEYLPLLQRYFGNISARAEASTQDVYQTPEQVAQVIVDVTEQSSPPLRIRTSEWAEALTHLKIVGDPDGTKLLEQVKQDFM